MSTIIRDCDEPYKVHYDGADISMIANKEKTVPLEWISEDGTDVNDRMERYLRPLIQGEKKVNYVNGIPEYIMMQLGWQGWLLYSIEAFVMVCYNHKDKILEADLLCLIDIFKGKQWQ